MAEESEELEKMAKTTTTDEEGAVSGTKTVSAAELKKELQTLVQSIAEEDDYALEDTDRAMQALSGLKKFKSKITKPESPPPEFKCPLSGQIMTDPVVIASGETFDRLFIQQRLNDGLRTCPKTGEVLSHEILVPNLLLKGMISRWCREHGYELLTPIPSIDEENVIDNTDETRLSLAMEMLSSLSVSDQKIGAKVLRQMTKQSPSSRALFGKIDNAISCLIDPLLSGSSVTDPDLQENLITTILNLSILESNKKLLAENPVVIPLLIEALKCGRIETRSNAAAALFSLSAIDSIKHKIGELGALKPLIELLEEEGHPHAMKDAATAIFNLCKVLENKNRAVSDGAVRVIMKKIVNHLLMDELLAILAMLSIYDRANEEMAELAAVPFLLSVIKENTSERNKENCIAILYAICINDKVKLRQIRIEEEANGTISQLAQNGTSRAKRKATGLLERINRHAATGKATTSFAGSSSKSS